MKYIIFSLALILQSCSISFNNISTEGQASDVLDENQTTSPKVDAVLEIPKTII